MSHQQAMGRAQDKLLTWLASSDYAGTKVDLPNYAFSEPDATYLTFRWVPGRFQRQSIGNTAWVVQDGLLQISAVGKKEQGTGACNNLAEDAIRIFEEFEDKLGPQESIQFLNGGIDDDDESNGKYTVIASVGWKHKRLVRKQA